jgi:DNA-binding transcriptional ArsR family regulator
MDDKRHIKDNSLQRPNERKGVFEDFVLDKSIFSNIFEKDIKRVYIYKKAERLAKAIHLVGPAFFASPALRDRLDRVAVGLVDAATDSPLSARTSLSRELLALSSVLSIARTGGLLSAMNAEFIAREAQNLLHEVASYEEPLLFLDTVPTLAELARDVTQERNTHANKSVQDSQMTNRENRKNVAGHRESKLAHQSQIMSKAKSVAPAKSKQTVSTTTQSIGHVSDKKTERRDTILSVLTNKGASYIKDISTVIRNVSEKTVQRELQELVENGLVVREGERRWTMYSIAS